MGDTRQYFRLDVSIPLAYRILTPEEAEIPPPSTPDSDYIEKYFMGELLELDAKVKEYIELIGKKSKIMADALNMLDQKVDFFIKTISEDSLSHTIPIVPVNLSAGGLAFSVVDQIAVHSTIDLLIHLDGKRNPTIIRAKVVDVSPHPSGEGFTLAASFNDISEDIRRDIMFFIQQKEIEEANKLRHRDD